MSDGNALLMASGTPWAKFPSIGATVVGKVLAEPDQRQQTDYNTGAPLTWSNNDPRMEIVVEILTAERDPTIENDKGVRALHIRNQMIQAVKTAVRAAGADGLHPGGVITVTYIGDGESDRGIPPKRYAAQYTPPQAAGNATLMAGNGSGGNGATNTTPPTAYQPQVAAQVLSGLGAAAGYPGAYRANAATAPAAPAAPPAAPPPPGIDPAIWNAMPEEQRDIVRRAVGAAPAPIPF